MYQAGRKDETSQPPQRAGAAEADRARGRRRGGLHAAARDGAGALAGRERHADGPRADRAPGARLRGSSSSMFERSHYRQAPVNDPVSSLVLDRYVESLDGQRSYFLASDIAEFERYRYQLDDAIPTGELEPAFAIFNRFQHATASAWQYALESAREGARLHARRDLRVRPRARAVGQQHAPSSTSSGASASRTTRCR